MERPAYRIIDANFNRGREAIRVIEEFCRFVLNSSSLTASAKHFRHEFSALLDEFDTNRLIAGRDTPGDVGAGQKVENQLERGNLEDAFTAACKRLTEALRVLAEVTQIINPSTAGKIENLRYQAYTLEKDIRLFGDPGKKFKRVKLYVIISRQLPAEILHLTSCCVASGADCIQLRAKGIEDDKLFAIATDFVKMCRDNGVLSIINDRVDIAAAAGVDGVHLGQNDLPTTQAKKLQLTPLIIGKSTHSLEQLNSACQQQVTYAALGPVFATDTKPDVKPVGLDYVRQAVNILGDTGIGHVAIGGISKDNVEDVLRVGARTIGVCSAITESTDPKAACSALKEQIVSFCGD